jgi:hypothetical protein
MVFFDLKTKLNKAKNYMKTSVSRKTPIFSPKIAENCDHKHQPLEIFLSEKIG